MLEQLDWTLPTDGARDAAAVAGRGQVAALLAACGTRDAEVVAALLWERFGSLADLMAAPMGAVAALAGPRGAAGIAAAQKLRVGLVEEAAVGGAARAAPEANAAAMAALLAPRIAYAPTERVAAALFDSGGGLIGVEEWGEGRVRGAAVPPRAIVLAALARGAARVVLAHNHPGGDPTPSPADRQWTRRLASLLADLDVPLTDHLVLARERWVSMRQVAGELF